MCKDNQEMVKELYQAFLKIETIEECENFLNDLMTNKEIEAMSQRLMAAKLLLEDKTYNEVIKETDISSATLSRVSRCVQYGNGYSRLLKKD